MKKRYLALFVAVSLSLLPLVAAPAFAGVEPSPWRLLTSGGFDNPIFWVAFNPQPEPPGAPRLFNVNYSTNSTELVFREKYGTDPSRLFFGFGGMGTISIDPVPVPGTGSSEIRFIVNSAAGGPLLNGSFTFASGGAGLFVFPGSDVMFNPQPEPPGIPFAFLVAFNLLLPPATGAGVPSVELLSESDVYMTLRLWEGAGTTSIALQPVPEPGTILLLGSGLAGLVGYGRKRLKVGNRI